MITSKKEKSSNPKDEIPFDLISIRMSDLMKSLSSIVQEVIIAETKKVKIKTGTIGIGHFTAEIQEIQNTCKNHLKKAPLNLESYLSSLNTRAQDLNDMLFKIKTYPIKSITNQLKKEAEEQGIENTKIKTFVNELTSSLVNLVLQYTIEFEEYVIDQLCEKEMNRIGMDFFTDNIALKLINQHKYEKYITLLYKGIKAFYYDFKAFANTDSLYFQLIETFFKKLILKIEKLVCSNDSEITTITKQKTKNNTTTFPTHIFKDYSAYELFQKLVSHAKNQEEIGFYFRQMSEKEIPRLIIAKETTFRTWFNEESGNKIELKNPIKTYDRIKGQTQKYNFYKLIKEKSI
ncbi:hypothetical protein [Flavobacterium sp. N2820]|uniref:hypothetical protein n=1 Tax=Flavobacterium sp. N2820 TaxID=2986834 RepID=UPI00222487FD|nr:hypothetical protein [Flavobacterium sp. N2820]